MRSILAAFILAVLLAGCQYSANQRNNPATSTSWNDQNNSSQPAYRQYPARAERFGFQQSSPPPDSPVAEDPAFWRQQNRLARRAYRQSLARADDPAEFGQGPLAADSAEGEDPTLWRQQNRLARRAYRQMQAPADDPAEFGQGPMASDGAEGEDPTLWRQQNRLARRAYRQSLARADDPAEFGQNPMASDAADIGDPAPWSGRDNLPRRAYRQMQAGADDPSEFSQDSAPSNARWSNDGLSSLKPVTLQYGGRARSYLIYVPSGYRAGQPTPLVLVFHGGGGNAMGIARTTNMHQLAERYTFIVVYPNGTGIQADRRLTWNAGSSPRQGYAEEQNVDDVGFVKAILQQVKQSYSVDPNRVYATGLSKGAMLTYRLACELSDQFAAIAPVAGTLTYQACRPTQPIAILHIHGSADQNVPLNGGRASFSARNADYPSPLQGLNQWRQQNQCSSKPTQATVTTDTTRSTYGNCNRGAEVTYYIVRGGGHGWPGSIPKPKQRERGIYISNQLNASAEIWNFFAAHPKP